MSANLKCRKMLMSCYLSCIKTFLKCGTTQSNNYFFLGCWLTWPKSLLKLCFHNMMVWVSSSEDNCVTCGKQTYKRWAICKQVVSLQLSNICTAASRIPLFIFFSPQTILIQNIYRNPQNSAQTADGSHCKSHSWRNFFKTMVLKSPLLIET